MEVNNGIKSEVVYFAYVSVMHAVPDAPNVDVYANDKLIVSNLAYGKYTEYLKVPAGTYQISIYAAGTKTNPVITRMVMLSQEEIFTVIAAGTLKTINLFAIQDADVAKVAGKALVRFLHLSPNAPAVDITLPDGTMVFQNVSFGNMTEYIPLDDKIYTVQVRVASTDTVVLTVPRVDIRNNNYYSIYAIGLVGQQPELEAILVRDGAGR